MSAESDPQDAPKFEGLPAITLAAVFSFVCGSCDDLAMMRLISKHVSREVRPLTFPSLRGLQCGSPARTSKGCSRFVLELMERSYEANALSDNETMLLGDHLTFSTEGLPSPLGWVGCVVTSARLLSAQKVSLAVDDGTSLPSSQERAALLEAFKLAVGTKARLAALTALLKARAFDPCYFDDDAAAASAAAVEEERVQGLNKWQQRYAIPDLMQLTIRIPDDAFEQAVRTDTAEGNDDAKAVGSFVLMAARADVGSAVLAPRAQDAAGGAHFEGRVVARSTETSSTIVEVALPVVADEDEFNHWELDCKTESPIYTELWDERQRAGVAEGVAIADDAAKASLVSRLRRQLDELADAQDPPDYHPHSNDVVRDLVHPALFPFVKGTTPLLSAPPDEGGADEADGEDPPAMDSWGRPYEASAVYQWLPTYFVVADDGSVSIDGYINNLAPRDARTEPLYQSLQELFATALPLLEATYAYGVAARKLLRGGPDDDDDDIYDDIYDVPPEPVKVERCSLRGRELQVITKIVEYKLRPGEVYDGVWHVEGMSHEEIVATAVYVLDRDPALAGGNINFKRAFFRPEVGHIFYNVSQIRPPRLEEFIHGGLAPLGRAATPEGRLLCFPNSHVHRVDRLERDLLEHAAAHDSSSAAGATRRIVVFFLVNPEKRIVSTREVAPQQSDAGGSMSMGDALEHRLKLMRERKFAKQDWNVREIELCEH